MPYDAEGEPTHHLIIFEQILIHPTLNQEHVHHPSKYLTYPLLSKAPH